MQDVGRQADGRRGVTLRGLRQNLTGRNLRKLPHNLFAQVVVGEHPQALGRDQRGQAIDGVADQRAGAHHVEHLLGGTAPAARPEAGAAPARQDQAIIVRVRHLR